MQFIEEEKKNIEKDESSKSFESHSEIYSEMDEEMNVIAIPEPSEFKNKDLGRNLELYGLGKSL